MNRIAVIVIGSNSTRSLCCDECPALSNPMRGRAGTSLLLRLKENPVLSEDTIQMLSESVSALLEDIRKENARLIGLYATSAVRDARNADMLSDALEKLCGERLQVLSGREEAAYSFYGAVGDRPRAGIIDIGGGSTEIALGSGEKLEHAYSLQLGASRLFNQHPINSPYDIAGALSLASAVAAPLHALQAQASSIPFYLVGGTGTASARIIAMQKGKKDIEGLRISREEAADLLGFIAATPREKRESIPGYTAGRADILPTGIAALLSVMDVLGIGSVQVTRRGNTDGLLRMFVHKKFS